MPSKKISLVISGCLFGAFILGMILTYPKTNDTPSERGTIDSGTDAGDSAKNTNKNIPDHPVIYVNIVSHNEDTVSPQYPDFVQDKAEFEREREGVATFAAMIAKNGAKYDFQTDWNFLLGMQAYDKGTTSTNGKNLLQYLVEDLGMVVDPHSHEHLGYNYADVAYLISTFGVTPTNVVGGFIAAPVEESKLEYISHPIKANKYDYTWTPEMAWGGGTGLHQNEEFLWISGVWQPKDADHFDEHDPDATLPVIGHYNSDWTGLDDLLAKQANGELESGKMYTVTIMNNQRLMDDAYTADFEKNLQQYKDETTDGQIIWITLPETYRTWVEVYNKTPSILHWSGSTSGSTLQSSKSTENCGDGTCSPFERKQNICTADCS